MADALAQAEETSERHASAALDPRYVLVPFDDLERTIGVTLRLNRLRILWKAKKFPIPKQISAHRIAWVLADLFELVPRPGRQPSVSSVPEPVAEAADAEAKALAAKKKKKKMPSPATRGQHRSKTGPPASSSAPAPAASAKPRRHAAAPPSPVI